MAAPRRLGSITTSVGQARTNDKVRAEIQNATSRGFRHTRVVYAGPRDTSPVLFVDDRDIQIGPMYWFRVRKTFGS